MPRSWRAAPWPSPTRSSTGSCDGASFFPAVNKGELAVVYCFLFFYFACRGGGRYSLDAALKRRG